MLNENIEIKLYVLSEGLSLEDTKRVSRDLDLIKRIDFMIKGVKDKGSRGLRNIYAVHKKGRFSGYRIEDLKFVPDKFDSEHFFLYSDDSSVKEITLEEMDEIQKTLDELKTNPA